MLLKKIVTLLISTFIGLMPLSTMASAKKSDTKLATKEAKVQAKAKKIESKQDKKQSQNGKDTKKVGTKVTTEKTAAKVQPKTQKIEAKPNKKQVSNRKETKKVETKVAAKKTSAKAQSKTQKVEPKQNKKQVLNSKEVKKVATKVTTKKADVKTQPKTQKVEKKQDKNYGIRGAKLTPTKIMDKKYSYREKGKMHTTISKEASRSYSQVGVASYYGGMFHGRKTANGEIFNKNAYTAAHKTLALGSYALVTNLRNGRKVIVRINDRGPFSHSRIIDLSVASAKAIGMIHSGIARVKVEAIIVEPNGQLSGKGADSLRKMSKKK